MPSPSARQLYLTFPAERNLSRNGDPAFLALVTSPREQLPAAALEPYSTSAVFTVGSDVEFRHFLPRILELAAELPLRGVPIEHTAAQLQFAEFDSWPAEQRHTVAHFFAAVLERAVSQSDFRAFDSWICALGTIRQPVLPHLHKLLAPSASSLLLEFHDRNWHCALKHRMSNPSWRNAAEEARLAADWLTSDAVQARVRDIRATSEAG